VVIVVKTGATEALARIPTLLTTFLSCIKEDDVLFFSDMEQEIAGAHLHDALVDVVEEAKTATADFELYDLQKQLHAYGGDVSSLPKAKEAWALDKYKNIHTAQKAWELQPNRTWYFFIDADTYIVWPSFFAWIKRLDPAKHLYLGRTIHTLNLFAHGGPGYLLSREAVRRLVGEDARKIASDFDISATTTCCGDAELAGSLSKKGVSLIDAYPLINHQRPREIPFGLRYWCQPIITMHHVSPEEINNLWQFQQSRTNPEVSFHCIAVLPSQLSALPALSRRSSEVPRTNAIVSSSYHSFSKSSLPMYCPTSRLGAQTGTTCLKMSAAFRRSGREMQKSSGRTTPLAAAGRPVKRSHPASNTCGTASRAKSPRISSRLARERRKKEV
jgi:hypothetical protein